AGREIPFGLGWERSPGARDFVLATEEPPNRHAAVTCLMVTPRQRFARPRRANSEYHSHYTSRVGAGQTEGRTTAAGPARAAGAGARPGAAGTSGVLDPFSPEVLKCATGPCPPGPRGRATTPGGRCPPLPTRVSVESEAAVPVQMELKRIIISEVHEQQVILLKEVDGDRSFHIMI